MKKQNSSLSRTFTYAADFYIKRLGILLIFSLPFIFAFLIPVLVPAPTYMALGGVFLRTGSIPELSITDIIITAAAYALAVFVIADTIVNINLIIRSKRTLTTITQDVVSSMGRHAGRIFVISTLVLLLLFAVQVLTYETQLKSWIYPLFGFALSYFLFFVPPAVVIDNADLGKAIRTSIRMASKSPAYILVWAFTAFLSLSIITVISDFVFIGPYSAYFVLLVNSLVILPFLTILQTQMYMEKYPLAR